MLPDEALINGHLADMRVHLEKNSGLHRVNHVTHRQFSKVPVRHVKINML